MKQFGVCLVVVLFVGLLPADEPKTEWVKVADKDAKLEGHFPAKPQEVTGEAIKQYLLEREGGKAALLLQVNYPPKPIDATNADQVKLRLDNGRNALVKTFNGAKLLSEKDLTFAKIHPARDVDVLHPTLGVYRVRMILTPNRLYQVVVLGSKEYQDGPEAKKFMDSFQLTD